MARWEMLAPRVVDVESTTGASPVTSTSAVAVGRSRKSAATVRSSGTTTVWSARPKPASVADTA